MFLFTGPAPPKAMLPESSGKACKGAVRKPLRFRLGLQASNGPSWWNTKPVSEIQYGSERELTSSSVDARNIQFINNIHVVVVLLGTRGLAVTVASLTLTPASLPATTFFFRFQEFWSFHDRRFRIATRSTFAVTTSGGGGRLGQAGRISENVLFLTTRGTISRMTTGRGTVLEGVIGTRGGRSVTIRLGGGLDREVFL